MINLSINNKTIQVQEGTTVLAAARDNGIEIPTLCWRKELKPSTSCMVCIVKNHTNQSFIPSCSSLAEESMKIETDSEEVLALQKRALELLLSEHMGDCDAPCQRSCPAKLDIPEMNRLISEEKFAEAVNTIRETIPLPAILGVICPAPCEKACRRKDIDAPVSICLVKRFAGLAYLRSADPIRIKKIDGQRKIAIVGAGPSGLTAAFYLAREGHACMLFDAHPLPGGALRYEIPREKLPEKVLDGEIDSIRAMGVSFSMDTKVDQSALQEMTTDYDYVLWCAGDLASIQIEQGVTNDRNASQAIRTVSFAGKKIFVQTFQSGKNSMAVKAVAGGRQLAQAVLQEMAGLEKGEEAQAFNSTYFRILPEEQEAFLSESRNRGAAIEPSGNDGYLANEAVREAARCLHCDCRKKEACGLRDLSRQYKAKGRQFSLKKRKLVQKEWQHALVVYEANKCIACGICIQVCRQFEGIPGLTFVDRGFDVRVAGALGAGMDNALGDAAVMCAEKCPTGAIAFKNKQNDESER